MTRAFLLGHGIAYSASPPMYAAAFRELGMEGWSYELLDVPEAGLAAAVRGLREPEVAGGNVTIPHKVAVMDLVDDVDAGAARAGAVNTLVNRDGRLLGSNTDVVALRAALRRLGIEAAGTRAVVLGAGGSARAAAVALEGADVLQVARDPSRAPGAMAWADPAWVTALRGARVLVNATPLGRHGEDALPEGAELGPGTAVVDLVYAEGGTPLVRRARERGLRCVDGWELLLEQGAAAFRAWSGREAPVDAMRSALGILQAR